MNAQFRRVRVLITGRVQGVWFRDWTWHAAGQLDLGGWVRNRADKSVEAQFEGPDEMVRQMIGKCHTGPRLAQVERVVIVKDEELEISPSGSFSIRTTA